MRDLSNHCDPTWLTARTREPRPVARIETADLVAAANAVIAAENCTLLLIERTVRGSKTSIRIDAIYANGRRAKGIARSGDPAMRAVCHAANAVLRQLAASLPANSCDRLGLMTDGTGVAYSPDCVSVIGDTWLGALMTGLFERVDIAAFEASSHWARISALQHGGRAH